jgi:outer membrane protein, heavy metal efflux system
MKERTSLIIVSLLLVLPAITMAEDRLPVIPDHLTLDWCLERAREANPALARASADAAAAGHRIRPAGAFEDPRFGYDASNIPTGDFDFDSTPLSGHQLGLRQKLPFPGLLSNRESAAQRGAEASDLRVDDQRLLTDSAVESAWAELGFAQEALDITNRNIALLRQLAATADSRYRVVGGNYLDFDIDRVRIAR